MRSTLKAMINHHPSRLKNQGDKCRGHCFCIKPVLGAPFSLICSTIYLSACAVPGDLLKRLVSLQILCPMTEYRYSEDGPRRVEYSSCCSNKYLSCNLGSSLSLSHRDRNTRDVRRPRAHPFPSKLPTQRKRAVQAITTRTDTLHTTVSSITLPL
jgi:hypothetical protein